MFLSPVSFSLLSFHFFFFFCAFIVLFIPIFLAPGKSFLFYETWFHFLIVLGWAPHSSFDFFWCVFTPPLKRSASQLPPPRALSVYFFQQRPEGTVAWYCFFPPARFFFFLGNLSGGPSFLFLLLDKARSAFFLVPDFDILLFDFFVRATGMNQCNPVFFSRPRDH